MSKESEKTITIVANENFENLPKTTQKTIKELSTELRVESLNIFNPIVENMAVIESYKKLKYKPEDEESIKAFKDAKSFIRSFRAATKKSKSILKKPYLETGKKIDLIEKNFIDSATSVLELLEKEFKPYLDEEERKKEERLAKKNKAQTDKIEELSAETSHQQLVIQRSNLMSKLKSEILSYLTEATENIKKFSYEACEKEIDTLIGTEFNLNEEETELLLPDQVEELNKLFNNTCQNAISVYETQLSLLEAKESQKKPEISLDDIPEFIAPSLEQSNPDYFKNQMLLYVKECYTKIANLNPANNLQKDAQQRAVAGLKQYEIKLSDFFKQAEV